MATFFLCCDLVAAEVTPGASREAQSLLTFFANTYGKKIISGQQDGWRRTTNGLSAELNYITNTTGKYRADISGIGRACRSTASQKIERRARCRPASRCAP